jgi:transposase
VRSERQFCEQLDYNLLFRWFLDMGMVEESFVPTVFTHNRDRLIIHDVAEGSSFERSSRLGRPQLHRAVAPIAFAEARSGWT